MGRVIFLLAIILFVTKIAYSQTTTYSFKYPYADTPPCNPVFNDGWKSSHGSPGYGDIGGAFYNVLELAAHYTKKSEGVFVPYNFSSSYKYDISISVSQKTGLGVGLGVFAASGLSEKSNQNCEEDIEPSISSKQMIVSEELVTSPNGKYYFITISDWVPNQEYPFFWLKTFYTKYTNTTDRATIFIDYIKIEKKAITAPDTQAPTVPTNLRAPNKGSTWIDLVWSASTDNVGVAGYKIYKNGALIGSTASTQYTVQGLEPCIPYFLSVLAYDAAGNHSLQSSPTIVLTTSGYSENITINAPLQDLSAPTGVFIGATKSITFNPGAIMYPDFTAMIVPGCEDYFLPSATQAKNAKVSSEDLEENTTEEIIVAPIKNASDNISSSQIIVFPNPTHNIINIKYSNFKENEKVEIIDFLGRIVIEAALTSELTTVDLSALSKGIYFVRLINNRNISLHKVFKK